MALSRGRAAGGWPVSLCRRFMTVWRKLESGSEEEEEKEAAAAVYVHWPYCQRRCTYCNFNKYVKPAVDHDLMQQCLVRESETLLHLSQIKRISSVYFGGGTPSLAKPATIAKLLETFSKCAQLPDDTEVTLEVNPTSAGASKLAEFRSAGVNRFSLGIQDAVSNHNLMYWRGRQYIGIGPGAHGRFRPSTEGGAQREARVQTLEPDVWMMEVKNSGHGTRKRVRLTQLDV
uniref:Radical S-adenosyl methionine domain containing 1 n=1 Tax=Erpetoichthys calabaricus TaxID=27687 RepID=A0A8C4TQI7_ERPCA